MLAHATRFMVINDAVRMTPDHAVFCVSRGAKWIRAGKLRVGDVILRGDRRIMAIHNLTEEDSELDVRNLVLEDPMDVFVANGVIVFGAKRSSFDTLSKSPQVGDVEPP